MCGYNDGCIITNCYYLDTYIDSNINCDKISTAKTEAEFNSGEVAYLLQDEQETQVQEQSLTGSIDEYPILTSNDDKKIYAVKFLNDTSIVSTRYANYNGTVTPPTRPKGKWSTTKDANGTTFTSDMTIYAVKSPVNASTVTIKSKTASTITVTPLPDTSTYGTSQYSINDTDWQTSNVFENLKANEEYTVYVRYSGNNTSEYNSTKCKSL